MIRVIYVDDEKDLLEIGKVFLERTGELKVDTAQSAKEAEQAMVNSRYDVIVSDFQMPDMDGLQYLKKIRQRDKSIPFILFTGKGREEIVIEACNSGVSAYMQKGGDPTAQFVELEHRIKHWVAKRNAEGSLLIKRRQAIMAMDMAMIASWEFDKRSRQFKFDDNFYQILGTDAASEGGYEMSPEKYIGEFVHPDDVYSVVDFMQNESRKIPADGYGQIQHRFIRRDGKVRKFLVRLAWIFDENGNSTTAYGVNYDITDLNKPEPIATTRMENQDHYQR